ncbi:hypothetical protein ABZ297_28570 [Nonomuraea sp. NPDC005983]|uniref:hypothetical protein n=1 Tax=Nonomuraea sp. NPDC005983 TaxID=3155595 RepID=UPI0033AF61F7
MWVLGLCGPDPYQATLAEHRDEREAWHAVTASWSLPAATDAHRATRTAKSRPDLPQPRAEADPVPWPTAPTNEIEGRAVPPDVDPGPPAGDPPPSEVEAIVLLEQMLGAQVITSGWPQRLPRGRARASSTGPPGG